MCDIAFSPEVHLKRHCVLLYTHMCFTSTLHRTDHPASLSWLAVWCPHVLISSSPQHEVGSSNSLWECRGDKSSSQPTAHRDSHTGSPLLLTSPPSSRLISIPLPLSAPEGKQCNTLRYGHTEKAESALVSSHEALLYHCGSLQARPVASSFRLVTTRSECGNYNYIQVQKWVWQLLTIIRESVNSLCRDGADPPIVRVHRKVFLTRERSRSKPFCTPSYSIPAFLYTTIPPK